MKRLALALAGFASASALLVAAALVWLCVTEPTTVAGAIGNGQTASVLKGAAALVVSALGRVVRCL